jgi:uncharacterized membrane protein YjgN (DUF898 family)
MANDDGSAVIPLAAPAALPPVATDITAAPAETPVAAERTSYHGRAPRTGGIVLGNALLNLVTLGFYRFWGKTRLRRYLWGNVRLWGDPVAYTGRGMELFVGFLIALAILIPISIVIGGIGFLTQGSSDLVQAGIELLTYLVFGFLIGVALFRARRYMLSRTQWRQIRAAQTGSSAAYGWKWLGYTVLTVVTLGLVSPVRNVALQRHLMTNTWFGDRPFTFDGRARELMGKWLLCWILALPTLGLSLLWYSAFQTRRFARFTGYENLRFELPVTFGNLFSIYAPYLLVALLLFGGVTWIFADTVMQVGPFLKGGTLDPGSLHGKVMGSLFAYAIVVLVVLPAIAAMMVTHRLFALVCDRLAIEGTPDFAAIAQSAHARPSSGEGLADALDVGGI